MKIEFNGKVAIVTGAASGIGRATAVLLAGAGARVAIADINAEKAETAAQEISQETGAELIGLAVDVGSETSVRDMVAS